MVSQNVLGRERTIEEWQSNYFNCDGQNVGALPLGKEFYGGIEKGECKGKRMGSKSRQRPTCYCRSSYPAGPNYPAYGYIVFY